MTETKDICSVCGQWRCVEHSALLARVERLEQALRELVNSPIEHEDPRISYVVMQVDTDALADARAALNDGEKQ